MESNTLCAFNMFIHAGNVDSARADLITGTRPQVRLWYKHTRYKVQEHMRCTRSNDRLVVQLVLESSGDTPYHLGESYGRNATVDVPRLTCHGQRVMAVSLLCLVKASNHLIFQN